MLIYSIRRSFAAASIVTVTHGGVRLAALAAAGRAVLQPKPRVPGAGFFCFTDLAKGVLRTLELSRQSRTTYSPKAPPDYRSRQCRQRKLTQRAR